MAISPLLFNGSISRMQDVSMIKHNEDSKGMVDRANFQNTFNREVDSKINQVHQSDDLENRQQKHDAKEKGKNEYSGDGGKNRHQQRENMPQDGRVIPKSKGGFDMKI